MSQNDTKVEGKLHPVMKENFKFIQEHLYKSEAELLRELMLVAMRQQPYASIIELKRKGMMT